MALYHPGICIRGLLEDSYIYPGGLHGYNVSLWIRSQIGALGLILVLLAAGHTVRRGTDPTDHGRGEKGTSSAKGNNAAMAEEVTPQPEPTFRKPVVDEAEATVAEDESDKKEKKESFWKKWTHRKPKQKEEEETPQEEPEKAAEPVKEEPEKVIVKRGTGTGARHRPAP